MNNMRMNNPIKFNFGAIPINLKDITVKQKIDEGSYVDRDVNFVEIDVTNENDIIALQNNAKYWLYSKYSPTIAYSAFLKYAYQDMYDNTHIFALTRQNDDFQHLDDNKLLGLVEVEKTGKDTVRVHYLQVNPDFLYTIRKPDFKCCGTAILNSLKQLYENKTISLSSSGADEFYRKNGFDFVEGSQHTFVWNKKNEKKSNSFSFVTISKLLSEICKFS